MESVILFILMLLAVWLLMNLWPMRKFAPWVPVLQQDLVFLFREIQLPCGSSFVDLGCGDGRVVFAAAKRFPVQAVGIELLYPLYWWCKMKNIFFRLPSVIPGLIRPPAGEAGDPETKKKTKRPFSVLFFLGSPDTSIEGNDDTHSENTQYKPIFLRKDLFTVDLSGYDTVYVYGLPQAIAGRVKEKFEQELKPGALVISPWFPIPGWEPERVLKSPSFQKTVFYVYRKV